MRFALAALVMAACTGEQVVETTKDAASADAAGCTPLAGNLLPDGDFSLGIGPWAPDGCERELVAGRCGRQALRVFNIKGQARLRRVYTELLPRDTKLHLRAWFRKSRGTPPDVVPTVFTRTYSKADGGEVYKDDSVAGSLTEEWRQADLVFTVSTDQTSWELFVGQYNGATATPRDFEVADLSITKE